MWQIFYTILKISSSLQNPHRSARPLKRLVTKKIEDLLARSIIQDEIHYGMTVEFDLMDDDIVISKK